MCLDFPPATVICAPAVPEPSVAVGVARLLSAQVPPVAETQDHSNALAEHLELEIQLTSDAVTLDDIG